MLSNFYYAQVYINKIYYIQPPKLSDKTTTAIMFTIVAIKQTQINIAGRSGGWGMPFEWLATTCLSIKIHTHLVKATAHYALTPNDFFVGIGIMGDAFQAGFKT